MKTDMSKKYVNDLVGSSTSACQAEQGEQAGRARVEAEESTTYSLTTADVDAYLATRQDDDPVGCIFHAGKCLLAQAFLWKYPQVNPHALSVGPKHIHLCDSGIEIPMDGDVRGYLRIFDDINKPPLHDVTKREWLEAKARDEMEREVVIG